MKIIHLAISVFLISGCKNTVSQLFGAKQDDRTLTLQREYESCASMAASFQSTLSLSFNNALVSSGYQKERKIVFVPNVGELVFLDFSAPTKYTVPMTEKWTNVEELPKGAQAYYKTLVGNQSTLTYFYQFEKNKLNIYRSPSPVLIQKVQAKAQKTELDPMSTYFHAVRESIFSTITYLEKTHPNNDKRYGTIEDEYINALSLPSCDSVFPVNKREELQEKIKSIYAKAYKEIRDLESSVPYE